MPPDDKKPDSEKPAGEAAAGADGAAATAEDLELIPDSLEDETKTDEELFDEIGAEEAAAANGEDAGADAVTGTDSIEDQLEAGRAAGAPAGEAKPDVKDDETAAAEKLWDGASEEAVAAFKDATAKIEKLEQADRSNRGRVSTLQRQLNGVTAQLQAAADADAAGEGDDAGGTALQKVLDSDKWKDFVSEYPEVAGPLTEVVAELRGEIATQGTKVDAISTDAVAAVAADVDEQIALLDKDHPDWRDVAADPEFGTWLDDQPRATRDAAARNVENIVDASEVAEVMGHFKAFRSEQAEKPGGPDDEGKKPEDQDTVTSLEGKRKRQREAAAGARPAGAGSPTGIPEDEDEQALWDAMDREDERKRLAG